MKEQANWSPLRHTFVKDEALADKLHAEGTAVVPFLNKKQLEALWALYHETHHIQAPDGGMFYSVYSQDLAYRKKVHEQISEILLPSFVQYFNNYRVVMNSFIVKANGPRSEFYLHTDSTGLDETKYSALSLWIPLHDITEQNGAMCIVPRSHKFSSPYRGISIKAPFDNIHAHVKKYLVPVPLNTGEALFFDSRIIHNSLPNLSNENRVVVTSGLFPAEAKIISCYQASPEADIELMEQDEQFLLEYPKFLNGCYDRPHVGRTIGFVKNEYPMLTEAEFDQRCSELGIRVVNALSSTGETDCNMINEPLYNL